MNGDRYPAQQRQCPPQADNETPSQPSNAVLFDDCEWKQGTGFNVDRIDLSFTDLPVKPIKVAAVDDSESTRWCLETILDQACEFKCVGSYRSGEEALREVPGVAPELVLMDIRLPGISGIECMRHLKRTLPRLTVVFVSAVTDAATMEEAQAAGAAAFLIKPFSAPQCLATLRFSLRRLAPLPERSQIAATRPPQVQQSGAILTDRENEVMRGLATGLLYKEIAQRLGVSFSAVHKHQHKIFAKLHASNRTEAISRWRQLNARHL